MQKKIWKYCFDLKLHVWFCFKIWKGVFRVLCTQIRGTSRLAFGGHMLILHYQVHGKERFPKLFSYEKLFIRFAKYQGHPTKSFGHNNICSSEAAPSGMSYISQLGSVKNTHLAARNPILQRILTARCPWNIKMWNGPIARKAKVLRCPNFLLILDFLSVTVWAKKILKILFRSKVTCMILFQNLKRCV